MPSSLRLCLLLAACLGSAHAQQPILATALPDAPSALLDPAIGPEQTTTPYPSGAIVNGLPYSQPTGREQFHSYKRDLLLSPRPYLHAAIRSAIEQARTVPTGWGQDFPGYIQRYGSAFGEAGIDTTVRYGLAEVFHEDVRYLICHGCSVGEKFANAALYEVTARHGADGHRAFSLTPIAASVSGPLVAYAAWYPPGYDSQMALRHVSFDVITRFAFNCIREFLSDRDTP